MNSKSQFPDSGAQAIYDELERTGVLSSEFKRRLMANLHTAIRQAYERGVEVGKDQAYKEIEY